MEVGEGRTKIPSVGIFYEYMLPPNQIWAHNSFSFKSYACTFAGKLLLISTILCVNYNHHYRLPPVLLCGRLFNCETGAF